MDVRNSYKKVSENFEEIILSTDDVDIINIAKYKINVPFIRPSILSQDSTLQIDVIKHALNFAEKKKNMMPLSYSSRPTL